MQRSSHCPQAIAPHASDLGQESTEFHGTLDGGIDDTITGQNFPSKYITNLSNRQCHRMLTPRTTML